MKIQQLEYIIAIAQAGSITAAAKNLYQAQPNISIALKELESEIGMQIFWRTPNGMVLTPEGESFLLRAKDIVESMHNLESDYTNRTDNSVTLKVASARSSYVASAIGKWVNSVSAENKLCISMLDVKTNSVIDYVCSGKADIGIIRIAENQLDIYTEQLKNRKLVYKKLVDFRMKLLMKLDSPLAKYDDVPFEELKNYIEIVHGDDEINLFGRTFINPDYDKDFDSKRNRICVHDSGNKITLIDILDNAFMWVAPSTLGHIVSPQNLIVRDCSYANIDICDFIIYKKSGENNRV
ncbi:MAG: LysR family transcriptional regulator, partial [Ruminococcus sp.]|nr:LysR family transcriptional regulator [Ruminococcus sp.]